MSASHAHGGLPGSITDVGAGWPAWSEVAEVMLLRGGYNTTVVVVGTTLLGVAAGIVGVFALLRKRSLTADALSHATLPGMAVVVIAATLLGGDAQNLPLVLLGATVTGVLGVLCIQAILRYTRLQEDAAIGLVLSVFFGAGAVLLSLIQSMPGAQAGGLEHFIYGQTAAMNAGDARLMGGIALAAVLAATLLLKEFALVCFNDAFAEVDGWPVTRIDLLMLALVVVVTVAGLQAVGLILVVAMLIIPPVAARFWTDRLWRLVVLAAVIGGLCGYLGAATSALLPRKPAGSVIVLTGGVLFLISLLFAPRRGVLAAGVRRVRLRLRIAADHLLELAFLGGGDAVGAAELARLRRRRGWRWWLRPMLGWHLRRRGLGRFVDGGFVASAAGLRRGRTVCRNHRLWEQYLVSYAEVAPSHLDWTVDQVEHVLGDELIDELETSLRQRGIDPRGVAV
ncbi:MAG: iron chelate uptake ABC transporter family permease subunit [Planctomycetota bacterium]